MSNITTTSNTDFSNDQLALIKTTVLNSSFTNDELSLFIQQCKRTGLDPITRQIYATKIGGKMSVQATIDGLRLIAERSDKYEGQTKAEWCDSSGKWVDVWLVNNPPAAARIGVFKKGFREATYATAIFNEYAQKDGFMWKKMPALMIAKVAEALALRKAFPNDLSGIYSTEEMSQAEPVEPTQQGATQPQSQPTTQPEPRDATPQTTDQNPADYVVTFGQYKGKALKDLELDKIESYLQYLENGSAASGKALTGGPLAFVNNAKDYLSEVAETMPPESTDEVMNF